MQEAGGCVYEPVEKRIRVPAKGVISMSRIIILTQGKTAIVDDRDYNVLSRFRWHANSCNGHWYATTRLPSQRTNCKTTRMHRMILAEPGGLEVDHINGDGLDNRRCNLRVATHAQNLWNQKKRPGDRVASLGFIFAGENGPPR